jgi:hypothetical protein
MRLPVGPIALRRPLSRVVPFAWEESHLYVAFKVQELALWFAAEWFFTRFFRAAPVWFDLLVVDPAELLCLRNAQKQLPGSYISHGDYTSRSKLPWQTVRVQSRM